MTMVATKSIYCAQGPCGSCPYLSSKYCACDCHQEGLPPRLCIPYRNRWLPIVFIFLQAGPDSGTWCDVDLQWRVPYSNR